MYNVDHCGRPMTIQARYAASEMQAMYSVVYLEKFGATDTAGYSAWTGGDDRRLSASFFHNKVGH
jgi:hypothetical protein